jgi:hypothetical protein
MHEEFSFSSVFMIVNIAERVGGDAAVEEPKGISPNLDIGILERPAVVAERFDLSALEGDAGLEGLQNFVVVPSLAVRHELRIEFFFAHGSGVYPIE